MHDLIVLPDGSAGSLTTSEITSTMGYAEADQSPATKQAYASDWRDFSIWCLARGASPLPAHVGIIGVYLSHLADSDLKASTIGRRVAAIADRHKSAGYDPPPTASAAVKKVLGGIRRTLGTAVEQKSPITAEVLTEMLKHCPTNMIGIRDRALLVFGFASAMRRSELSALNVEDLTEVPDGLRVLIRRSKTDQTGEGQTIAIPRGYKLRPVEALQAWLAAAEIAKGPVFRSVRLGGRVMGRLPADDLAKVYKRAAERIGLDPALYSGHSTRSGYVTSAVEADAALLKICEVTRHRSLEMLRVYSRRQDLFREHSGASFL
jgi:integrase